MPLTWQNLPRTPERTKAAILSKVVAGPNNCWIWTGRVQHKGYGAINFSGTKTTTHRALYQIVNGIALRRDQHIMHSCDVKRCCNPMHLSVGDNFLNQQDRVQKGRFTKLKPQDIFKIRFLKSQGHTQLQLARQFDVGQTAISRILMGKRWGHLKIPLDITGEL